MAQSPGVFSLENVEVKLREGEWATRADYWRTEALPNTGYYAGGNSGLTSISKTQFATDTSSNIAPTLPIVRGNGSTLTSETTLYMAAGAPASPPVTTKTDKLVYATDTVSTLPSNIPAPSNQGIYQTNKGMFGTKTAGYMAGGVNWPSNSTMNDVWKIPFANESWTQVPGMPQNMTRRVATSSETHGYIGAGYWPSGGKDSRVYKMSYSTDSGSNFSTLNSFSAATGGSATSSSDAGYVVGGDNNYTYKLPFSTDATNRLPGSNYPLSEVSSQGAAGNTTHGYHGGGTGGPAGTRSSIYKFNYTTGGWSSITGTTGVARENPYGGGAMTIPASVFGNFSRSSDNEVEPANLAYMYSGNGGSSNSSRSNTFKLDMDLDTWSTVPSMPSYHRYKGAQFGNLTHGFFIGGYGTPSPSGFTRVGKMSYSTETISSSNSWPNPYGGYGMTGVSNQVKGYAGAGYQPGPSYHGRIYKYDIPTETITRVPSGSFSGIKDGSASGNETESYWGGGYNNNYSHVDSGNWTQVQKLTYSSDTFAVQPSTNIYFPNPAANNKSAQGDGNSAIGYHAKAGYSQMINYATGTFYPGSSSYGGTALSVMSNDVNVYSAGPSASQTGKHNFATSTDLNIADMPDSKYESYGISIRGRGVNFAKPPTVTPTSGTGFTFNPALPNFAMNAGAPSKTQFVKLDYATDVMTTVPGQFIYVPNQYYNRTQGSAASSATAGYFAGGSGGPGQSSGNQWPWVDKYVYSSDTQSRMPDATGIGAKNKPAAGNHEKAYWVAGGEYPISSNDVSKLVFSTGAWTAQPSARPGATVRNMKVAGGPTEVWCLGGQYVQPNNQPSQTPSYNATTIGKITYSNDTYSTVPSGTGANVPGGYARAMSNSTAMYTGGAGIPVDKFTFATTTNALFSSMAYSVPAASSASNEENGYWIGGAPSPGGSKAQKLSFSSGTVTVCPTPTPSSNVDGQMNCMATSARSDANAGTSGPTIL